MTLTGNQLNRVDDASTASAYGGGFEFKDAVKQDNEYAYDATVWLTTRFKQRYRGYSIQLLKFAKTGKV